VHDLHQAITISRRSRGLEKVKTVGKYLWRIGTSGREAGRDKREEGDERKEGGAVPVYDSGLVQVLDALGRLHGPFDEEVHAHGHLQGGLREGGREGGREVGKGGGDVWAEIQPFFGDGIFNELLQIF